MPLLSGNRREFWRNGCQEWLRITRTTVTKSHRKYSTQALIFGWRRRRVNFSVSGVILPATTKPGRDVGRTWGISWPQKRVPLYRRFTSCLATPPSLLYPLTPLAAPFSSYSQPRFSITMRWYWLGIGIGFDWKRAWRRPRLWKLITVSLYGFVENSRFANIFAKIFETKKETDTKTRFVRARWERDRER